jgi:PAS domain S-box-containing protein
MEKSKAIAARHNRFEFFRKIPILWRIFFYFLLIVMLFIGLSYVSLNVTKGILYNEVGQKLTSVTKLKISQLHLFLEDAKNKIYVLATNDTAFVNSIEDYINGRSPDQKDYILSKMDQLLFYSPSFLDLSVIHPLTGEVLISTDLSNTGLNKADMIYFQEGKKDTYLEQPYYSETLHRYVMSISSPIKNSNGDLVAVLAAHFNLKSLDEILVEYSDLSKMQETYLISPTDQILAGAGYILPTSLSKDEAEKILSKSVDTLGYKKAKNGFESFNTYTGYRGNEVIGYSEYLPFFDSVIITEQDASTAFAYINRITGLLAFFNILVFIIFLFESVLVIASISRPLKHLTVTAEKITKGDYTLRSEIDRGDEIGILAKAFDSMADNLVENLAETENIIKTMPDPLCVLDKNGNIILANPASMKMSGYNLHQIIGKQFLDNIQISDPRFQGKQKPKPKDLFTNGNVMTADAQCVHKNKTKSPISLSGSILRDKKGGIAGYIMIAKDIRELKHYARKRVNEILPVLNRISLGDFSGSVQMPDKKDEFTDLLVGIDLMSDNLRELIEENTEKTKLIESSQDKLRRSHLVLQKSKADIEEEKAKAEAFLGSLGEGIIAIDLKGNIFLMNKEAERMFGKSLNEVIGAPFIDHFEFKDGKGNVIRPGRYPISDAMTKKQRIYTTTYFIRKGVPAFPLATTVSPILLGNKLLGVIGTFRDITKEQAVDRAKTEFVSLASHQLRTPLTAINWLLQELVRKAKLNKNQQEYIQDAITSNNRMIRLVNDLLNVSRLETGTISVVSRKTDIGDLIIQVIEEAKPQLNGKKQKAVFQKPHAKVIIEVDPDLLTQVLANLISNATKYSDPRTAITIELIKKARGVIINVKDQGIGIPKDQQHRMFEKFFRTGEAAKRSTTGSGLGMYIVKKIVEACMGKITFTSAENKGSTFTVILPEKGPVRREGIRKLIEQEI